jgi:cytochrome c553
VQSSLSDPDAIRAVAFGIAKVVAKKTLEEEARFHRLDGLAQAMAISQTANSMADSLLEEAMAAIVAHEEVRRPKTDLPATDRVSP